MDLLRIILLWMYTKCTYLTFALWSIYICCLFFFFFFLGKYLWYADLILILSLFFICSLRVHRERLQQVPWVAEVVEEVLSVAVDEECGGDEHFNASSAIWCVSMSFDGCIGWFSNPQGRTNCQSVASFLEYDLFLFNFGSFWHPKKHAEMEETCCFADLLLMMWDCNGDFLVSTSN